MINNPHLSTISFSFQAIKTSLNELVLLGAINTEGSLTKVRGNPTGTSV